MGLFDIFGSPEKKLIKAADEGGIGEVKELLNGRTSKKIDVNAEDKEGYSALLRAASHGYNGIIQILLEKGANIDSRNANGQTSLIIATIMGKLETVKYLVSKGANVNARPGGYGDNAAVQAAESGYQEIYDFLIQNGATDPRASKNVKVRGGNCIVCHKRIGANILGSLSYTDSFINKCGACGVIYCLECEHEVRMKVGGACVKCEGSINNIRKE